MMVSKGCFEISKTMVAPYRIQYRLPNNMVLLVTIDKFDPNLMLVNINKLKPCRFIENKTLQVVSVKPSDLVTCEDVQTR
jgi:hypothetical protein